MGIMKKNVALVSLKLMHTTDKRRIIMEFIDTIKGLSQRIETLKASIQTEESTKMSFVVPFFQALGYDVFNPMEFCPEYTADVGIKKGEKVDYAIIINNEPIMLIECKSCNESLDKHGSQLFRYFGTSSAKFGILTNGIIYRFYTDLDEANKMDLTPFLEINMLDLKENLLSELKKFSKEIFDRDNILSTASDLKYSNLIKDYLKKLLDDPTDDYVRFILNEVYDGQKSQKVIDKFKPIVKKACTAFINDIVNQKISSALTSDEADNAESSSDEVEVSTSKIITTADEIEAFYIIRGMLVGVVDINDVVHRDTESYFGILYKDNNRKPICRLNLDTKKKQILIPDANKTFTRYYIESLNDLYSYKDKLIEVVKQYV